MQTDIDPLSGPAKVSKTLVHQNIPLIPLFAFYFQDIAIVAYLHLCSILFVNKLVYYRSFQELHRIFDQIAAGNQ